MRSNGPHAPLAFAVVGLVAAAAGFAAGWTLSPSPGSASLAAPDVTSPRAGDGEAVRAAVSTPARAAGRETTRTGEVVPRETEPTTSRSEAPRGSALFSDALLAFFDREFREDWASIRATPPSESDVAVGLARFRTDVQALPRRLAEEAGAAANTDDAVRSAIGSGDGIALLEAIVDEGWELPDGEVDAAFFDRVFGRHSTATVVDGARLSREPRLTAGMELAFGPGFHRLDERQLRSEDRLSFPADVTISGAGIDNTLLTVGDLSPRSAIRRLVVRDLTLDCGNDYFFDLRYAGMELDLVRVRVVRFDMGAGASLVFGTNRGALVRARDCEFLGGFGRSPGSGNLLRGDAFLMRFENSRFEHLDLNVDEPHPGRIEFLDCVFRHFVADPTRTGHAVFRSPAVAPLVGRNEYRRVAPRSLAELFPGWTE